MAQNIEDENDNSTTFVAINRGEMSVGNSRDSTTESVFSKSKSHADISKLSPYPPQKSAKTSIAFHFSADAPGSLFTVFKDFADAKINMTKIESRPTKKSLGDYIFYLDFDGNLKDPNIQKTLKSVEEKVAGFKVLGSY